MNGMRESRMPMGRGTMILIAVLACVSSVHATLVVDTVTVGNPGNVGVWSGVSYGGYGPDRICGAVDYFYNIGKFEITAWQYSQFLNAVAATDTYGLYNPSMDSDPKGCQITQNGSSGNYTYDFGGRPSGTEANWVNRPVNYVSWGDAARFANWLHNGQPTGGQDLTTTEDGSYYLNGVISSPDLMAVTRESDASWVIPTEHEWYKAAYHKNDGATGNYFIYPTSSDSIPSNLLANPDPGNNGTFYSDDIPNYTVDSPYWRTEVGDHENSESPYGTFDMGGNVWEWNETNLYVNNRGIRGSSFRNTSGGMHERYTYFDQPADDSDSFGFRLAYIPEVPAGTDVGGSDGGGSTQTGGIDFLFDEVTLAGDFTSNFETTAIADLDSELAQSMNFILPTDPMQMWNLDFDGDFAGLATLTFGYDDADILPGMDEEELFVYHRLLSDGWEPLPVLARDTVGNTLTVTTDSFSMFVLGGVPEPATLGLLLIGGLTLLRRRR